MEDAIVVGEETFISSRRASELSGYTQDYIGQLARAGKIHTQRVSGLWYVDFDSLSRHKNNAEAYVPKPPPRKPGDRSFISTSESIVALDGKQYVSATFAARDLGYHQDYVSQLGRSGKIPSQHVNHRWFVDLAALRSHKAEKDSLMGAVQAESVGLERPLLHGARDLDREKSSRSLHFSYVTGTGPLVPEIISQRGNSSENFSDSEVHPIPIRIVSRTDSPKRGKNPFQKDRQINSVNRAGIPMFYKILISAGFFLTFLVFLSFDALMNVSFFQSGELVDSIESSASIPVDNVPNLSRNTEKDAQTSLERLQNLMTQNLSRRVEYNRSH